MTSLCDTQTSSFANTTTATTTWPSEDQLGGHVCDLFFFVIYGPCFGVVCGLGLVGNALSFAVLHRYSRDNVATYLLKSLAIADNLLLLTGGTVQIGMGMAIYFGYREQLAAIYPYVQTYAWPAVQITQLLSVWMTVLVAANRYVAVCKPLHAHQLCTKRRVRIQIAVMVVLVVLTSTPRFFEHVVDVRAVSATRGPCDVSASDSTETVTVMLSVPVGLITVPVYNILYENVFYCLFVFFLPLVVLVFFNVHLVNVLKQAKRNWTSTPNSGQAMLRCVSGSNNSGPPSQRNNNNEGRQLVRMHSRTTDPTAAGRGAVTAATECGNGGGVVRNQSGGVRGRSGEENNITLVMAIIVLTFIACETPATINQFMFYALQDDFVAHCSPYQRFFHVCNLLVVINSSMNFVIYCLFRRQFQRQLLDMLFCQARPARAATTINSYQSSSLPAAVRNTAAARSGQTGALVRRLNSGETGSTGGVQRSSGRYRRYWDDSHPSVSTTESFPLRQGSSTTTDYVYPSSNNNNHHGRTASALYQGGSEDISVFSA